MDCTQDFQLKIFQLLAKVLNVKSLADQSKLRRGGTYNINTLSNGRGETDLAVTGNPVIYDLTHLVDTGPYSVTQQLHLGSARPHQSWLYKFGHHYVSDDLLHLPASFISKPNQTCMCQTVRQIDDPDQMSIIRDKTLDV